MTALQIVANQYTAAGWTITQLTDEQFVATRKKPVGALAWVGILVGLLFFVVPGLLILMLAYMTRDDETVIVTKAQAENMIR